MKELRRLALVIVPLVVCACTSPKAKKKSTSVFSSSDTHETSEMSNTSNTSVVSSVSTPTLTSAITSSCHLTTSGTSSTSGQPPVPTEIVEYVAFHQKDIEVKEKQYQYVTIDFAFTDAIEAMELDEDTLLEYKCGSFVSDDTSIATVSEYGKVTGVKQGQTTITYTTKYNAKVATLNVYIYNDETIVKREWVKMESTDTIATGDQIIIGCPQKDKAASMDDAGHNHLDVVDVVYNDEKTKITNTNGAGKFIVGDDYKGRSGFTLEIPERSDGRTYLCATNVKNIEFQKTAKTTQALWEIFYHNEDGFDDWIVCSHVDSIDGAMMYNVTNPQFNLYQSAEIENAMYYITIYKLHTSFLFAQ